MGVKSAEKKSGRFALGKVFGTCRFWPSKRSLSTGSAPRFEDNSAKTSSWNSFRRRSDVDQGFDGGSYAQPPQNYTKLIVVHQQNQVQVHKPPVESTRTITTVKQRKVPKEPLSLSGELESMIVDYQKVKGNNNLVRASSGNFMLHGHLGNLTHPVGGGNKNTCNKLEEKPKPDSPCKALATKMDPENLINMGNEDYKKGKFGKALKSYEAAIAINPFKASHRIDRSAALEASGRILEAVFECKEAIRIQPRYHGAHGRLANLYLRLGEVEKAKYHFQRAGSEAHPDELARAKTLEGHLNKCNEAKRLRKWNGLIEAIDSTIKAGADSSLHMCALKAEALLKLHKHQEANEALLEGPKFNDGDSIKHFGPIGFANLLVVQAQVDMAFGRFDDALAATERAVKLDSKSKEVNGAMSKVRAVMSRRFIGNEQFKSSNFYDACITYGEALEHDPRNSCLLLSRAVCYSKLRQYELAIEDCTRALSVRPALTEARLERANYNYKLGRCQAAIEDYEILKREMPDNEQVRLGLSKSQGQLKLTN